VARQAGESFRLRFIDPASRGDWWFSDHGTVWREAGCQWLPPGKLSTVGKAQGGKRIWRYDLWFKFFLVPAYD
jgi:hypothetical protein